MQKFSVCKYRNEIVVRYLNTKVFMMAPKKHSPACQPAANIEDLVKQAIADQLQPLMLQLQEIIAEHKEAVKQLQDQLHAKDCEILQIKSELKDKQDELEQYQRRQSIRIFGIPEETGEDSDVIAIRVARDLGVDLDLRDIDRSHRVGRRQDAKPRPIIVKFVSYRKRNEIFRKKKGLKGSAVTIREDLTTTRLAVLREAITRFGVRQVWSTDGVINIKVGLNKYKVCTMEQLNKLK